jgi:purine nucleoside permease
VAHRLILATIAFLAALATATPANATAAPANATAAPIPANATAAPIPIRVVVVTTFERDSDSGDVPGEFQYWVERLPLPKTIALPLGYHHLRYNAARGILGIVTGEGAERGAASIMALGADPRFDLSKAYWVIAGIAGVDPNAASVGSAAWANWVVNGDLGYEVDARDMPPAWSTGILPFERRSPYQLPSIPADSIHGQEAYKLNAGLTNWAYNLTANTSLPDNANLQQIRVPYAQFPNASRAPFVLRGDSLCGDRFWIGAAMNTWAEQWVTYWTGGHGTFVMSAEEDAGIMQSLTFLAHAARIDAQRILVLRTASDYTAPGTGEDATGLLAPDSNASGESAYHEALEAAYRVGSRVVNELATHWNRYRQHPPTAT